MNKSLLQTLELNLIQELLNELKKKMLFCCILKFVAIYTLSLTFLSEIFDPGTPEHFYFNSGLDLEMSAEQLNLFRY